jgi:two-component system cell cycle sensor histidine kinase/response regulator CckA
MTTRLPQQRFRDLEQAQSHLAAIVEFSDDAIISKTLDGIVLTWNAGAERLYGYSAAEAKGQPLTFLLPAGHLDEEVEILDRIKRGDRVDHVERVRQRKDGRQINVSLTISPIKDSSGQIVAISHTARDTTEYRRMEEAMRRTQRLESLGVLAGGVAHDFNNLLTTIMGNVTLALDAIRPTSPDRLLLDEIARASKTAADLTRQLLAYAGKGRFLVEAINLSQLVRDISTLVQTSIPKNVQLRLSLADDLPPVEVDTSQVQQVVMNLVINAGEAIGEHVGTILLTTEQQDVDEHYIEAYFAPGELEPGKYVVLEVNDSGSGMDEPTKGKIFDPFFTTKKMGRGLGLSAVQGIVRGHKGAMRVYSTPGKGTTFKVLLPATSLPLSRRESSEDSVEPQGSGRILIVDDEAGVRRLLKAILERRGYSVITAADGAQAIDVFKREGSQIDLVLLDLTMPIMSGEETFRELHRMRPNTPVLLSSGFNESETVQRFSGKGLAGFVQKPYTARQVTEIIRQTLSRVRD